SRCGTEYAASRRPDDGGIGRRAGGRQGGPDQVPQPVVVRTNTLDRDRTYGSLEIFTGVDLAIDRGSRVVVLGLNGAGKTTLLRLLAGVEQPDAGAIEPGYGLKIGYFAQEHDTLDDTATVWANIRHAAP